MHEIHFRLDGEETSFEEAVTYFGQRIPVTAAVFYEISREYRSLAFTVGGYTNVEIIKRFYDELSRAITEGTTLAAFHVHMHDFLTGQGFAGLDPAQAENIFRTNVQTAYQAGHYRRMRDPGVVKLRPFWQYLAVEDDATRPAHLAMNGKVFRADSPVWDTWYPPNGFRCRCTVRALSARQIEALGLTVESEIPRVLETGDGRKIPVRPDANFDTNPAKVRWKPDLSDFPPALRRAYDKRAAQGPTPAGA